MPIASVALNSINSSETMHTRSPPQPTQPTIYLTKKHPRYLSQDVISQVESRAIESIQLQGTLDRLHRIHNALDWMYVAQMQSEALP